VGTVVPIRDATPVELGEAVRTYLTVGLAGREHDATRRVFGGILRRLAAEFGASTAVTSLDPDAVAAWFTGQWAGRAPSTWNVSLDAIRRASAYWQAQGWTAGDPAVRLRHRRVAEDRSRAMSRAEVGELLAREDIGLRERTLWRMLYETAARSAEVLGLDVENLDPPNRRAPVRRKGGAVDVIIWQTGTARLLPRLLRGRSTGPVFVTSRKARVELPAADLDPHGHARLSYQQAEALFKTASGGRTLHQLRHSALTHAAEDGVSTPMLMARSGHTSVRSLVRYARVSAEALARHQAEHDPARRRY
jgi:integrase